MARFDAVFEGGGAKGVAFVGALEVLGQHGHTLRRYIGTSAGAITATLLAAGYTTEEMMAAVMERQPDGTPRFSSFMDSPEAADFSPEVRANSATMTALKEVHLPFVPAPFENRIEGDLLDRLLHNSIYAHLFSFTECGGYYAGAAFLDWLHEKLAVNGIQPGDTLADFARKTGSDLSVVASDTTEMEMLVLNARTAPNVPTANAVRMSMSIPFVWQQVVWQDAWGTYMGRKKAGNDIVDGGMLSNFPIRLIADTDDEIRAVMGVADPNGALNLGFLIDETIAVPGAPDTAQTPLPVTRLRTVQRISRMIDTMMGAADNEDIRRHAAEICRLPAKSYGTLEFGMQGERLDVYLTAARTAMTQHLAARALL
ncbi:MAG: patatin-like phospholipase family protein [Acidobacteriota bacterium]|nr:patatin-like phospholipase family protein [Acidobacteriota bacterium]